MIKVVKEMFKCDEEGCEETFDNPMNTCGCCEKDLCNNHICSLEVVIKYRTPHTDFTGNVMRGELQKLSYTLCRKCFDAVEKEGMKQGTYTHGAITAIVEEIIDYNKEKSND